MKYNQHLNKTLGTRGEHSQATLQYTKSSKLAQPLPAVMNTLMINHYNQDILYLFLKWANLHYIHVYLDANS